MGDSGGLRLQSRPPVASGLWAAIGSAACAAMIPLEPSLLEEGLLVHFAQRLVHGEHLYRDLVFFSGPFPFELLAMLFRVFGEEVVVGRTLVVLLAGASTGCAHAIARRAGAGAAAHAVAAGMASAPALLFPLYSTYFYSTLSLHLGVLAAYAALRGMESARFSAAAGVAVACVALTKQNLGVVLAVGLVSALFANAPAERRVRQTLYMLAGGASVAIVTGLRFGWLGDLGVLFQSIVVMPFELGDSFASGYVNLWPLGEFDAQTRQNQAFYVPHLYSILSQLPTLRDPGFGAPIVALTQFLFALPVIAVLLPPVHRAIGGPLPASLWFGEALLIAMIANLFPRADWGHLVFVLPTAAAQIWMTVGSAREAALRKAASWASWTCVAALGTAGCVAAGQLHQMASPQSLGPRVPQLPVSRAYQDPGVSRAIAFLRARTQPGEAIFVARAEPLLYFATDTRNPTPYGGVLPGMPEPQQQTIINALAEVRYVVMSEIDQPLFLYYRDELPAVASYLERFFRVPNEYQAHPSWILVLERGEDRGPAMIDLFELRSQARAWTRGVDGVERDNVAAPPELASRQNRRPLAFELGSGGGGLDFSIEVPDDAIFRADVGIPTLEGERQYQHARGVRLEALVGDNAGRFQLVYSEPIGFRSGRANPWRPIEVDLSGFAGRSITLRLQAVASKKIPPGSHAWWGSPILAAKQP